MTISERSGIGAPNRYITAKFKWENEKRKFYDSRAGRYCAGCKQLF